jgi:hypothetical protein
LPTAAGCGVLIVNRRLRAGFRATDYTLLQDDVRGPFLETIPSKMEDMKDQASLGYTSPKEKLAEKFHMSQELLVALNPGKQFNASGERITVANVSPGALPHHQGGETHCRLSRHRWQ